jgi:hypothetical protein
MNSFYTYKLDVSQEYRNVLVCYVSSYGFDFDKFSAVIKKSFDGSPFSQEIVVLSASYNRKEIKEKLVTDINSIKTLKRKINNYQIMNVHLGFVGSNGSIECIDNVGGEDDVSFSLELNYLSIIEFGLIDIVSRRKLVMEASSNFHYIKPSGKHSDRFIKASNVLEVGSEISFLAINLLKMTGGTVRNIYTDTAGIFPLAYELLTIIQRFKGDSIHGFVDSFGGYEGLESYEFSGDSQSLVLISASTSDDLLNELRSKSGLSGAVIVSLFTSSECASEKNSLISFVKYYEKYKNIIFKPIKSTKGHKCDLCIYEKSIPLSLSNKNFAFEAPKSYQYLPVASDSSKTFRTMIANYQDSGAFKCLYDGLDGGKPNNSEFFIDISKLVLKNKKYKEKLENSVIRNFPLYADVIIHAKDNGASDIAKFIQSQVKDFKREVQVYSMDNIDKASPKNGIVVVAGSIQTGKSLLDISRKLRTHSKLPITYIIGFAKFNDPVSYLKLKNDLIHNNGNPKLGRHQFVVVDEIMLPLNEYRMNSWERELEVLKILSAIPINSKKSHDAISRRNDELRSANTSMNEGLGMSLFLPSLNNKPMILGKTFAFWNEPQTRVSFSHQATVYYTMSNILQGLRYSKNKEDVSPLGNGYVVNQLNPLLFDRFNEGIIQASVLRTAKSSELDFSADDSNSSIVGTLIENMILEPNKPTSEALPEFLLALCTRKLQIKEDHIKNIQELNLNENEFPMAWILLAYTKLCLFGELIKDSSGKPIEASVPF